MGNRADDMSNKVNMADRNMENIYHNPSLTQNHTILDDDNVQHVPTLNHQVPFPARR
jgi:hypothetical protein